MVDLLRTGCYTLVLAGEDRGEPALIDFDRQSRRWLAYRSVDDAEPFGSFAAARMAAELAILRVLGGVSVEEAGEALGMPVQRVSEPGLTLGPG